MSRPPKSEIAPGVYSRGKIYWLRYTPENGEQVRISLGTSDKGEAIRKADEQRGKPLLGKGNRLKWDRALSAYLNDSLKTGRFRPTTAEVVKHAAEAFRAWSGVTSPDEVTSSHLQDFYDFHSGKRKPDKEKAEKTPNFVNVGTAQGYTSKLATFLRYRGISIKVSYRGMRPKPRDVVVPNTVISDLIRDCKRADLRFVLFSGFHEGLRKEEIIMARPEWFRIDLGHIAVPEIQEVDGRLWEVKSRRSRKIPLTPEFKEFLKNGFGDWTEQKYMLHPEAKGLRYRWDFRRPFENYMASKKLWVKNGKKNVTPHAMRHTYITNLADKGYSAAQISAWSGDRIRTLETNYLHTSAPEGAVDNLYSKKKPLSLEEIADSIQSLKGQIGEDTAKAFQKLLQKAQKNQPERWIWSDQAPAAHQKLYSVQDTIEHRSIFQSLFDESMPDAVVTELDWEEGKMSTKRARLTELEAKGWIREV